jgi:hypothetical protein
MSSRIHGARMNLRGELLQETSEMDSGPFIKVSE